MELIQYLLGKLVRLVLILGLAVFVVWLAKLAYPNLSLTKVMPQGIFSFDFLPSPRNYGGLLSPKTAEPTVFNGYGDIKKDDTPSTLVSYTYNGQQVTTDRYNFIRNLSVYEGGTIGYGFTFYGEARSDMFRNSIFTILILDAKGNVVSQTDAIDLHTWSTPGFERFQATIQTKLPPGACSLVFLGGYSPIRVTMPVQCR